MFCFVFGISFDPFMNISFWFSLFFFFFTIDFQISFPLKDDGGDYNIMWVNSHEEREDSLQGGWGEVGGQTRNTSQV